MNEDVAQELNKMANAQGKTLFSLTNEIANQALEAKRRGFSLEDAISAKKLIQSAKSSRMVLVNQDLWYFASSQAMKASSKKWQRLIRDSAQWQAHVFLDGSGLGEFLESLKKLVTNFYWDCTDVRVEPSGNEGDLTVRLAFVPEMPSLHTQALFTALEGLFNTQNYVATDATVRPGFFTATFKKIGGAVRVKGR
jgi:hypothetical protein